MTGTGIGIVGFGRIGAEHAGWISQADGAFVAAVFDPTPARRDLAESRGFAADATIEALFARDNVQAVLISTPSAMHFEHATLALRHGRHVLVEKPVTLDLDQAQRLLQTADDTGRVASVFHNRRWNPDALTVAKHLRAGTFGRLINIESRLGQWSSCIGPAAKEYRPGWRNERSFGGGGLFDWGSHFVDQLWRIVWPAKPVRVFAQLRGNIWTTDCDDFARVCIDFDNGAVGVVEINTTTTRALPRWHIDGTLGSADGPASAAFDVDVWSRLTFTPADGSAEQVLERASPSLDEPAIWSRFASACRGQGAPAVSLRSVLGTMRLLDAARDSSELGRAVDVSGFDFVVDDEIDA